MTMMRRGCARGTTLILAALCMVLSSRAHAQTPATSGSPSRETAGRPPLIVAVAIDGVGMARADLRKCLDLVLAVFDRLPSGSEMAIGSFSGDQRILQPPTGERKRLEDLMDGFKPGPTGVALPDGLYDMVTYLANQDASGRAILLISGGNVREGDLQFEDPLNAASSKGIRIVALGLGQGDGKQLRRVAKLTGGDYVHLEVADPAMLALSILPPPAPVSPIITAATPASPAPEAAPSPAPGGLLGAAAVFLGFGGLLIFGVIVLLIRRMSLRPAGDVSPAPSQAMGAVIASKPRARKPDDSMQVVVDDFSLEKTMVVNANPILRALSGPGAGKNFPLAASGPTSLGRSRRNDIVVPEDAASAQHCRIDREGDSYVLYDLGATNGTWVNGARTERAVLGHGDRLKVGETVFTVSLFGDRS